MGSIYILPVGIIGEEVIAFSQRVISSVFGADCESLEQIDIPGSAYDSNRMQYLSTVFLETIINNSPDDALRIIGITPVDLFIPILTFVFGQAQLDGKAAVVSTCRLRQEFYELPANKGVFLERLAKELVHELGHTFGLVHCKDITCAMHFSNSVREIDLKGSGFCTACSRMLERKL